MRFLLIRYLMKSTLKMKYSVDFAVRELEVRLKRVNSYFRELDNFGLRWMWQLM